MKFICSVCGYVYDEDAGIPDKGIAPGTTWESLPEDWKCPLCGAAKSDFRPQESAPGGENGAGNAAAEAAAGLAGELEGEELRELTALETSILCSNLAKGCEKQHLAEEAEAFRRLADYYRSVMAPADGPSFEGLRALAAADLDEGYPLANAVCTEKADRGALRSLVWSEKVTRIQSSLLARFADGGALPEGTGVYVCPVCGFIYVGDELPELCPVCKIPNRKFEKIGGETNG